MNRRAINLAAGMSLVMCVATVGVWIYSYWASRYVFHTDRFFVGRYDGDRLWSGWYLAAYEGRVFYERQAIEFNTRPTTAPANRWAAEDAIGVRTSAIRILVWESTFGFSWVNNEYQGAPGGTLYIQRLLIPLAAVFVGTLVLPVWWLRALIHHISAQRPERDTPADKLKGESTPT